MPIWPLEPQPSWLLALAASGCVFFFLLTHFTRKARAQDWAVASLWMACGSVVLALGLWLMQGLSWLAVAPQLAHRFELRGLVMCLALVTSIAGVGLLLLRHIPSLRVGLAVFAALLAAAASAAFSITAQSVPPLQATAQAPITAGAALWLPWAAAAALGLIVWVFLNQRAQTQVGQAGQGGPAGAKLAVLRAGVLGGLVLMMLLAQGLGLQALHERGAAFAGDPVQAADDKLLMALAFAGFVLVMAMLTVIADMRSGRRATVLKGSLTHAHRKLEELAFWDPLTGLPNRLRFEERIDEALAQLGRHPAAMAVMFIDIDGFKAVNDSRGHAGGDEVLREVGHRLAGLMRPEDTAARVAGDEFLVLMVHPGSIAGAGRLAQQILDALARPFELTQGGDVRLSCSIGVAMFPEHGPTSRLIAHADAAAFAVKRTGGAAYAFFEPRMEVEGGDHLSLQNDLRQAIERGELELFYQPKIDVRTRGMSGVEALVRWQHAGRGAVASHELIAVAERFGLIGTIGQWVLDQTCWQIRQWAKEGLTIPVAVNLSAHQVRQPELVERVTATLQRYGVSPSLITFEITESEAMEDTQATLRCFAQLSRLGVGLSIDDFGTGHSSLAYLRTLPAKQVKIDRSFVADLGTRRDAVPVVEAVIRMAHALGLRVVAEGVETDRQCEVLTHLGCDELQGYLFARPMNADRLALWACGEASAVRVGEDMPAFADTEPGPIVLQ